MSFEPRHRTLVQIYERSTREHAGRPLFGTKRHGRWTWMTYGEMREQVEALRGGLAQKGLGPDDAIAVIANNRPEWAIAAYATYTLGARYVPMYESQRDEDWKYILADSGAKLVFTANAEIATRVRGFADELPELQEIVAFEGESQGTSYVSLMALGRETPRPLVDPGEDAIAGFIYTSGTTGNPKGVLLSHGNLAMNVSAIQEVFPLSSEDRSLSFLPWAHSFGQTCELHGLLAMGASTGIAEAVDKIVANLAEVRPTVLFSVPRIFNRIYDGLQKKLDEGGRLKKRLFETAMANARYRKELARERRRSGVADLKHEIFDRLVFQKVRERFGGRLRYAFSGGAALSKEVAEFIDDLGIKVYEGYGLTETSPVATANFPGSRKIGSVGKPIPGVRIEIDVSATEDPVQGEILIFGHNVMQGYHGLEEENAKVLIERGTERGFRSGDMGYVDPDGFLFITGRIKEQYKLQNGKYVVPAPLEEKLKLSRYIGNLMIHGMNQAYNVALIVPDFDSLERWASQQGLPSADREGLLAEPAVERLFRAELDAASKEFKPFEKIRRFRLIAEDFTTDNGMLTPSLKLKRRVVMARWAEAIEALFEG